MPKNPLKPGATAPSSGQYQEIGPRGGKGREVTSVKGEPLPPTTKKGSSYKLVDPTNNKSGKRRQQTYESFEDRREGGRQSFATPTSKTGFYTGKRGVNGAGNYQHSCMSADKITVSQDGEGGDTMAKKVKIGRDAKTGKFIPVKDAKKRPSTTVVETIKKK